MDGKENNMAVYKKLQEARAKIHKTKLTKSGKNAFAKFNYFELADFMPTVTEVFNEHGLCGVVSFTNDTAYLTIYNADGESNDFVTFTSPLVLASMDRIQPIQSLGATHTYFRRYLYLMALDLVENDLVDSAEPQKPKLEGKEGEWQLKVSTEGNWGENVKKATNLLLSICGSVDDINNTFKVNRVIYDKLKSENNAVYEEIMDPYEK